MSGCQISRFNCGVFICTVVLGCFFGTLIVPASAAQSHPNVILILTDDQGYGDLSCHGNSVLKTPNIDALYRQSVRFTDFHVMPFCTPTRASLMTGRNSSRTGAYRTSSGRSMMHTDEVTMADVFKSNGYATGIFGKWHLGDNYPHRPQDRGFTTTLWHRCGGVGQASDYWGNDYFDDTYECNGKFEKFTGYCTDVWFDNALKFVKRNADAGKPFFAYIPTNAPHGPYVVDPKYAAPYQDKVGWRNAANFYGMIANIDENVSKLRSALHEWGIEDNTILIFMTDNGTSNGFELDTQDPMFDKLDSRPVRGFNAGMRGRKSSIYDGGHRVPFFIRWPGGKIQGGRDVTTISAGWDVLPTLIELCQLTATGNVKFDGRSLVPFICGEEDPDRTLVMQYVGGCCSRYLDPQKWRDSVVMTRRWRLLSGELLYDLEADPTQSQNVAARHPEVIRQLRGVYERWWPGIMRRLTPVAIHLGHAADNPTTLCSQDWYMKKGGPPWNFGSIKRLPKVTAPWIVHVDRSGTYEITLRQWPAEANKPIVAAIAKLRIAGVELTQPVVQGSIGVTFRMKLPVGPTRLETFLTTKDGQTGGAYFADVHYLE